MTRIGRLVLKSSEHGADQSGPVSGSSIDPHLLANSDFVNSHPCSISALPAETADCPNDNGADLQSRCAGPLLSGPFGLYDTGYSGNPR